MYLLAALILFTDRPSSRVSVPVGAANPQVLASYGKLPLYFIENQGQLDPDVSYYIQGGDKSIYFTGRGVTFALTDAGDEKPSSEALVRPASYGGAGVARALSPQREAQRWVVKLDFVDADPKARPVGQEPTAAVISYFKGAREEWTTGLPTYASLVYRDLWPGIDLVYTGTGSRLKYTFVVQPGADPSQIKLAYRGASGVRINDAGQLEVSTPLEDFQEDNPYAYQEVEGQRLEVEAAYSLEAEGSEGVQFGFRVGAYDPHKVLVLDPVILLYAGYIGGHTSELGGGIAVDSAGNSYVAAGTRSEADFPVTVGPDLTFNDTVDFDAFVAKVNPSGTALVYAGYIGGSGDERGTGIAVDTTGNAYVTGATGSTEATFPVAVGPDLTFNGGSVLGDAFVAKVNASGTALDYAGYIGGSSDDFAFGIAVDTTGDAYVAGETESTEATFPVTVGPDLTYNDESEPDVFVAKISGALFSLDLTSLTFADENVGTTSAAQRVTVTNNSGAPLTITTIVMSGDFAETNTCDNPLAVGDTCTIDVTFTPTVDGTRTGVLTITDDTAGTSTVALSGIGTDLTITVPPGSDTVEVISAGGTANYELLLVPAAGFVGTVTLTCTGVPAGTTCTVTPNMVTLDGTIGVAIMVIVTTTAPSLLMPPAGPQSGMPWLPWLLGLAMTVALAEALRRRSAWAGRLMPQRAWPVLAATLLFAALWASCGSEEVPRLGGGIPTGGTPAGTSTLMINASSGGQVIQTIPLTLTVN